MAFGHDKTSFRLLENTLTAFHRAIARFAEDMTAIMIIELNFLFDFNNTNAFLRYICIDDIDDATRNRYSYTTTVHINDPIWFSSLNGCRSFSAKNLNRKVQMQFTMKNVSSWTL